MDLAAARKLFAPLPVASVATVGPDGAPHVVPLWFVWPEDAFYVSARRPGRTWNNATSDPRVSIAIDVGRNWVEVAGIVVHGRAEPLAPDHPSMRTPISAWHEKYPSPFRSERDFSCHADMGVRLCEEIHKRSGGSGVTVPAGDRREVDVLVVGAGPGGSATAYHLARHGIDGLPAERSAFPREKVCGDGLTPRGVKAIEKMGIDPHDPGVERVDGLRIRSRKVTMELPWPRLSAYPDYGLVRTRLD